MKHLILLLALLSLTACSNKQSEQKHTQATEQTSSSTEAIAMKTVFTGEITSSFTTESDPSMVSVVLRSVEAVSDPDSIVPAFENDGVIIHVSTDNLGELTPEQLSEGSRIQCTLKGLPIMTMSIPPQLPGNSIEKIELVSTNE
ncbi:hypothetical protein [Enterococcus sp. AZ072]|uniref:hypothetical protein n=1 Tax=unclassified Enterococcus TaxID=2608891 RepID=UPI003D292FFA